MQRRIFEITNDTGSAIITIDDVTGIIYANGVVINNGVTTAAVTSVASKTGAVTLVQGDISGLVAALAAKAPLASPVFTGTVKLPAYTVATLPVGAEEQLAYATDGRKVGEGAGVGTGVPVYFSNGQWRVFATDAQVAA